MRTLAILCCLFGFFFLGQAQQETPSPILFIYDASGSMWGAMENNTKKEIASAVLAQTVNSLPENQGIGLVAYGHRKKGDCRDVEFLVDLNNQSKSKVNDAVKGITPLGRTPLEYSAKLAIDAVRDSGMKATIILITDGIESCDGNICDLVTQAKTEGINFKLHIVGFGLKEGETEQLQCAANAGDGKYFDAANSGGLGDVLAEATSETVDDPTGNFSIYATLNGLAVDAWVRARKVEDKKEVDMGRSYGDSAWVYLPAGKYELEIQPLEGTDIPSTTITVEMKEGEIQHRDVSFDGGTLQLNITNNTEGWDALVTLRDPDTGKEVARARTYRKPKSLEVPAGSYNISIKAMGIEGPDILHQAEGIQINPGASTTVLHNFESGIAMVGVATGSGELVDGTINIYDVSSGKNMARGRSYTRATSNPKEFVLSPGTYEIRIKTLGAHKGHNLTAQLKVEAGKSIDKIITIPE